MSTAPQKKRYLKFLPLVVVLLVAGIQAVPLLRHIQGTAGGVSPLTLFFFSLVVGIPVLAFLIPQLWKYYHARKWKTQLRLHPGQPWMVNPKWRTGRIVNNDWREMAGIVGFAVLYNTATLPMFFIFPYVAVRDANYVVLVGLVLPVAGLPFLRKAVSKVLTRIKYGRTELEMLTMPGVLGRELRARVYVPAHIRPEGDVSAELYCLRVSYIRTSNSNRKVHRTPLWEDTSTVDSTAIEHMGLSTVIPVRFSLPNNQPESHDEPGTRDGDIEWKLTLRAETPGIDLETNFLVPVFRTDESPKEDPDEDHDAHASMWSVKREHL